VRQRACRSACRCGALRGDANAGRSSASRAPRKFQSSDVCEPAQRRLAVGKIVLKADNGLFVALALSVWVGPMPKNVSKHGANHRRCARPSTRRAIDRLP
jgi:hypothetical protein